MNGRVRLLLCATCLVVGLFEARGAMHVFAQDLQGPYDGVPARATVDVHGELVWADRAPAEAGVLAARAPTNDDSSDERDSHADDRSRASARRP